MNKRYLSNAELAAIDEAICKADSEWCSSLEALGLESERILKDSKTKR